jgi:hypothetical protein
MLKLTKTTLIAGTTVLALAGIGTGAAFAASSDSTTTAAAPSTSSPTTNGTTGSSTGSTAKHKAKSLWQRTEHGEVTLRGKKNIVLDVQRGQVSAVTPTTVTVKSTDGFTATYTIATTSKVCKDKQASTVSNVVTGDHVTVVAQKENGTDTVRGLSDTGTR